MQATEKSFQECHESGLSLGFDEGAAKAALPQMICQLIQTKVFQIANSFPNMEAERCQTNASGAFFTCVKAKSSTGQRVIFTISSVHTPKEIPRAAAHRNMLNSNRHLEGQCELFETSSHKEDDTYAVLIYGSPQASIPGFINIAFPDEKWTKYIHSIPLPYCPGIISHPIPEENDITPKHPQPVKVAPEEEIKKEQSPRIRPRRKAVGDE